MNAEIIAVGSELLLGQIVNTNAQFLSKELAHLGINVYFHTVVGDNEKRLTEAINVAEQRANLILITGGLGPTDDDLTKETVAKILNKKLIYHKFSLDRMKAYFEHRNIEMTENNQKQALVIEGSDVFFNDVGLAPGMAIKQRKVIYMLLPGPPNELKVMFKKYAFPYMKKKIEKLESIESRVLRFFGIGEAQLEMEIKDLIDKQSNPTIAPLASDGEVTLRLTAKHSSIDGAQQMIDYLEEEILQRVGEYFYGYDETSLSEQLFKRLNTKGYTIAAAESLTGGLFTKGLTDFSGSSNVVNGGVVCYTNKAKEQLLHIDREILDNEGAISESCAKALAENVKSLLSSHIGVSFTGVAGPTESEGKPVGTVYIGMAMNGKETKVFKLRLAGSRTSIRNRTVKYGYFKLLTMLDS